MGAVTNEALIRPIRPADDAAVAAIIRTVMASFGASGSGFASQDPEVDAMSASYAAPRSVYFVLGMALFGLLGGLLVGIVVARLVADGGFRAMLAS